MVFLIAQHPFAWMWLPRKPEPALAFLLSPEIDELAEETTLRPQPRRCRGDVWALPGPPRIPAAGWPESLRR